MMTGKWTCLATLILAATLASGCSSLPDQLKFGKKDRVETSKTVDGLSKPVEFHLNYAQWREEAGDLQEAAESYRIVLSKAPENLKARLGLARISMKTGDMQQAEQLFEQVLKEAPGDHEVLDSLGQFYAEKNDWHKSVAMLEQAVKLRPENRMYRYHYAAALAHFGKTPQALVEFRRILTEDEAHYNLAYILKKQGDLQRADFHVRQALAINSKYPEARQLYEEIKFAGGQHLQYANHSRAAGSQPTHPAGYQPSAAPSAIQPRPFPGTIEYHEEKISPLDFD